LGLWEHRDQIGQLVRGAKPDSGFDVARDVLWMRQAVVRRIGEVDDPGLFYPPDAAGQSQGPFWDLTKNLLGRTAAPQHAAWARTGTISLQSFLPTACIAALKEDEVHPAASLLLVPNLELPYRGAVFHGISAAIIRIGMIKGDSAAFAAILKASAEERTV